MSVGRPAFEITEEVTKKAEALAAQGLTLEQIASSLGIHYDTLNEKRKAYPEFSEAIQRGRDKGIATVTNALFNKAKNGDMAAIKYYLNNRGGAEWSDKTQVDNTSSDGSMSPSKITRVIVSERKED